MLASAITDRASELLQDMLAVTWTVEQLISWVNDGQRVIVSLRPDATAEAGIVMMVTGTLQSIPADGHRIIDTGVVMNMGANGLTPGNVVRQVDRRALDENTPGWHAATPAAEVRGFVVEPAAPGKFWVTPPSDGTTAVRIIYSKPPVDCIDATSDIGVPEMYAPMLIEWCMYRALARDSEDTPNSAKSANYYNSFFKLMGDKAPIDAATLPNLKARP